ncbi:MAG: helix-turn-helix domain-containing protein [Pseudoclavibacter sp.]
MDEVSGGAETPLSPAAARVLSALRTLDAPATVAELGRVLGLHPTTVRFHLDRLAAAGLVALERSAEGRRGRPALRYRPLAAAQLGAHSTADPAVWRPMVEALAEMLDGEMPDGDAHPGDGTARRGIGTGAERARRAEAAGARWADELWAQDRAGLLPELARLGFSPERTPWGARLRSCPFAAAAGRHPGTICAIHLGLARRLARHQSISGAVGLVPFAEPNACRLTFAAASSPQPEAQTEPELQPESRITTRGLRRGGEEPR